ncbi:hypothetical protein ACEPAF_7130 [Sanghuangporus sanghuang]
MSTRQRGVKRSIDGAGGNNFVFAPNVDLNAGPNATPSGPPPLGASANVGDGNSNAFPAAPMNNPGDASANVPVSVVGAGASAKKNDRRHRCNLCGKLFNRPSSLKIHLTTHTGERPFPCPYPGCGRAFNVSSNMRRHFRTHNGGGQAGQGAPASTPELSAQQQQQQQTQQGAQPWNVNMYNPSGGGTQAPRARAKRSKAGDVNGNDGETSEGADVDGGSQAVIPQSMPPFPPFPTPGAYPGFPPPFMNIPGLPGMPEIPGLPDMHSLQGVPMGMQMMPIEMAFPVDPALTGQKAVGDPDADAEGDEDGDEDADGENDGDGEGEGDTEGTNRPQLTHSTSNTRASTDEAKARTSARVQAKAKVPGASPAATRGRGRPPKATTAPNTSQQQVQFRQILVPVSVPLSGDPAQAARIAQQYQQQYAQYAKYAQYAQYYMQQQQAQAQTQAQAGQASTSHLPPLAPPQQATMTVTSVQRPGPATSAERTTPAAPQSNTETGEPVGRSVFVHWGPKNDTGSKDGKDKIESHQHEESAMATLAESAASLSASEAAKANEASTDKHATGTGSKATDSPNAVGTEDAGMLGEQSKQDSLQGGWAKTPDAPGPGSSPVADGDGIADMDVDEPGDAEDARKTGSPASPRKRGLVENTSTYEALISYASL